MKQHATALAAKVAAVNAANKYRNEIAEKLFAFFTPLIGQKVLKADGSLLQKIAEQMPAFLNTPALSVYRHNSPYSLVWVAKACEGYGEYSCVYHDASIYVANLNGSTVESLFAFEPLRCNYTTGEVLDARDNLRAARKVLSHAESALAPFGEHDR